MDRFSLLSRRLGLPLAGLTSVGLLWLALTGRTAPLDEHTLPVCRVARPQTFAPAARLPSAVAVSQQAGDSRPSDARPAILAAAFGPGPSIDHELPWPGGKGPALGPLAKVPDPVLSRAGELPQPSKPSAAVARPVEAVQAEAKARPIETARASDAATPRVLGDPMAAEPARAGAAVRSRQLESIAQEADRHSRKGYELAGREAYFAARREFINALRLVAQGLDMEHQSTRHSRALGAGLTAIAEAEDFVPPHDRIEADLNVAEVVTRHRTPVLQGAAQSVAPMEAMKAYFTFAQEQLSAAAGSEVAGSMALHGLGKLHSALGQQGAMRVRAAESKAMTYYQASLLVDPQNYMASNDLGVLLARSGQFEEARQALEHSLSIRPQAAGWRNLAHVYQRLGEGDRAARADRLYQVAARGESAAQKQQTAASAVQWVDPPAFAQSFANTSSARDPLPARPAQSPAQPAASSPVAQKPFSNLFEKR